MAVRRQPVEHRLGRRVCALVVRGDPELDERDEPPVRSAPLLVRVHAEPAVALLAAQQPAYERAREEGVAIDGHVLSEHVASGQVANRRLARGEQELNRGGGIRGDRYVAQGSLSQ